MVSLSLQQHFLFEALLCHEFLHGLEVVTAEINILCLLPVFVEKVEHWRVMRYEVEPEPNVRVSVAPAQDELAELRQLVQASAGAGPDLTSECASLLALEALLGHKIMNLLQAVASKVQSFLLLSMFVEENQIRVVVRDEIYFQSSVSVSVAGLFDESPSLRQLVQASAGAALNFSTPSLGQGNAFCLLF